MSLKNKKQSDTPKPVDPIFKYIGGKSWMRDQLRLKIDGLLSKLANHPHCPTTYSEPFSGGLGAFLGVSDVLLKHSIKKVVLNDLNQPLIAFYKQVYLDPLRLIHRYTAIESRFQKITTKSLVANQFLDYKSCVDFYKGQPLKGGVSLKGVLKDSESYYKSIRQKFNAHRESPNAPAYLLFLQNHCFNGIYRENSSGHHNTPFNWSGVSPSLDVVRARVMAVHHLLHQFQIQFSSLSFEQMDWSDPQTLYYLDPPYLNEQANQENSYQKGGFSFEDQKSLILFLIDRHFVYSNHYSERLLRVFDDAKITYSHQAVYRKNIISSSASDRNLPIQEMLLVSGFGF